MLDWDKRTMQVVQAIAVFLLAFMLAPLVHAGNANLSWTKPVQNVDGTSLTNLSGYTIQYGTSASALTQTLQVNDAAALSATVSGLAAGTWYFSVVTNSSSDASAPSNPVSVVVAADPVVGVTGVYGYCRTGTSTNPSMTSIGYLLPSAVCTGTTQTVGGVKFCSIAPVAVDKVIFCSGDPTLSKGVWSKSQ